MSKLNNTQENFGINVLSQVNTGSAGGTMYYINLGGIKMLWGQTAANVASAAGPSFGITFPTSFFTTVQSGIANLNTISTVSNQSLNMDSLTATSCVIFMYAAATTGGEKVGYLIIGT